MGTVSSGRKTHSYKRSPLPVVLAEQLLEIAHRLDECELLDLTQDNRVNKPGRSIELKQDKPAKGSSQLIDVTSDKITDESRLENGALSAFQ